MPGKAANLAGREREREEGIGPSVCVRERKGPKRCRGFRLVTWLLVRAKLLR